MSERTTLGDITNWAFNNNGHLVDYNRVRISDGTPLYSTGLTRFASRLDTKIIALSALFPFFLDVSPDVYTKVLMGIVSAHFFSKLNAFGLRQKFNRQCFNKNPKSGGMNIATEQKLKSAHANNTLREYFWGGICLTSLILPDGNNLMPIPTETWVTCSVLAGANAFQRCKQIKKVLNGKWSIDEISDPINKVYKPAFTM